MTYAHYQYQTIYYTPMGYVLDLELITLVLSLMVGVAGLSYIGHKLFNDNDNNIKPLECSMKNVTDFSPIIDEDEDEEDEDEEDEDEDEEDEDIDSTEEEDNSEDSSDLSDSSDDTVSTDSVPAAQYIRGKVKIWVYKGYTYKQVKKLLCEYFEDYEDEIDNILKYIKLGLEWFNEFEKEFNKEFNELSDQKTEEEEIKEEEIKEEESKEEESKEEEIKEEEIKEEESKEEEIKEEEIKESDDSIYKKLFFASE
jgi:hypothetical protein